MPRIRKKRSRVLFGSLLIAMLFTLCSFNNESVLAASVVEKRVLFISSYSYAWETVPKQIEGIEESLPEDTVVDFKFMDTKNVGSKESMDLFYESMQQYLNEVPPYDVVILGDDAALEFAMEHKEELFVGIPLVFEGINSEKTAQEALVDPNITGVMEKLSYENTLKEAITLYPDADHVVAILDDSITGNSERDEFYSYKEQFPQLTFGEIDVSQLTREQLCDRLGKQKKNTILIYIMCSEDKNGNVYTSSQSIEMVAQYANIPVFSIVSVGMGKGVLGGEIVSQKEMGRMAGEMAQKIINGAQPKDIQVIRDTPREFWFDENVMDQYDIKRDKLPEDAMIINHTPTFLEQNAKLLGGMAAASIILFSFILLLVYENFRKGRLNAELTLMQEKLEREAKYDALTSLLNRRQFMDHLQERIDENGHFGVILFDIDNFKKINDSLGHNNGDVVLRELARRALLICDEDFMVYRLAGDEFTAIVESDEPEKIQIYVRKIQQVFESPFMLEKKAYHLHSSIGVAIYPGDGTSPAEMIAAADEAMYRVKNNGKNNFTFFSGEERV